MPEHAIAAFRDRESRAVFVTGVNPEIDEDVLRDFFDTAGPVEELTLVSSEGAEGLRRQWVVVYEDGEDVRAALGSNGQDLNGDSIEVTTCADAMRRFGVQPAAAAAAEAAGSGEAAAPAPSEKQDGWPQEVPRHAPRVTPPGAGLTLDLLAMVRARPAAAGPLLTLLRDGGLGDLSSLKLSLMAHVAQWRTIQAAEAKARQEAAEQEELRRQIEQLRQQKQRERAEREQREEEERRARKERRRADRKRRRRSSSESSRSSGAARDPAPPAPEAPPAAPAGVPQGAAAGAAAAAGAIPAAPAAPADAPAPAPAAAAAPAPAPAAPAPRPAGRAPRALQFEGMPMAPSRPPPPSAAPAAAAAAPAPSAPATEPPVDQGYVSQKDTRHLYVVFPPGARLPAVKQAHQDLSKYGELKDVKVSKTRGTVFASFAGRGDAVRCLAALSRSESYSGAKWHFARTHYSEYLKAEDKGGAEDRDRRDREPDGRARRRRRSSSGGSRDRRRRR
eukprot:TRINITY_DN15417_c2_g1_i1.p1 TRINITY_DN15417_c2_g1~~TRINITY_DN15417_c2_g1_i1.p1  ORF type:complete len:530 (+),score=173.45 TRINITY_DN15417_c2_g1_i1:79-1590(+)